MAKPTKSASPNSAPEVFDYTEQMRTLHQLVQQLEAGQVDFELSLSLLEKGLAIADACEAHLKQAEQKLLRLTRTDEGYSFVEEAS
jgi:exodeoxyribonuclease VII small subunit